MEPLGNKITQVIAITDKGEIIILAKSGTEMVQEYLDEATE